MLKAQGLARAADSLVDASLFMAALGLPLYFSVLTETGYEPDKAVLVRVFSLLAVCGLALGALSRRGPWSVNYPKNSLVVLGLFAFLAYVLSSALSIDPRVSIWGSLGRQQGLWTIAAYLVMFAAAVARLRIPSVRERFVTALLLGSVPAVAYGLLQLVGYDPVPSGGDPNTLHWPVRSAFGQHVFFGSYLVLVIPFTIARLIQLRHAWSEAESRWWRSARVVPAALALAVIIGSYIGFMALGVQHPALFAVLPALLGGYLLIGLSVEATSGTGRANTMHAVGYGVLLLGQVLVLLGTGARGAWLGFFASLPVLGVLTAWRFRRLQTARGILIGASALALFILVLNVPNGPLQPLRGIHGLNRVANISDSGGAGGSAQGRLLIWEGVSRLMRDLPPVGGTGMGGPVRLAVGYGPETMRWAFQSVYPLKLRQVTSEIWTWDRAHDIYLDHLIDAGVLGLLLFLTWIAVAIWRGIRQSISLPEPGGWLLVAAVASITGHLVDGFFGLEMAVTLALLWMFVGLIGAAEANQPSGNADTLPHVDMWLAVGYVTMCLILATVAVAAGQDHPLILGVVIVVSCVAAVAAVASACAPNRLDEGFGRLTTAAACVAVLCISLALGSQVRVQAAAIAERDGLSALAIGQIPDAIGYLQQAARLDQEEPQFRTELGGAFLSLGAPRLDSGNPSFDPVPGDTWNLDPSKATVLGRDQLFSLARFSLQSSRNLAPLDPDTYNNLGNMYLAWNKPDQALPLYQYAESLSLKNPRYLDQQALALLQGGHVRDAEAHARSALSLDTTFWYSYYTAALVDRKLGHHARARAEAAAGLGWVHNYWPPPPQGQLGELQTIVRAG